MSERSSLVRRVGWYHDGGGWSGPLRIAPWCVLMASGLIAGLSLVAASGRARAEGPSDEKTVLTDENVAARLGLTTDQVRRLHTERALSNEALLELPRPKLTRALWRLGHPMPDQPQEAAEFRLLLQQGGGTPIPPNALTAAIATATKLQQQVLALPPAVAIPHAHPMVPGDVIHVGGIPVGPPPDGAPAPPPAPAGGAAPPAVSPEAGMLPLELEPLPLGPAAMAAPAPAAPGGLSPGGWKWLGPGNIGGRTRSILVHPTNPSIMWVGAVAGGVWKTVNAGTTWAPLADFMANLNVSCLALDPTNPNTLYAGTGEGFYNGDALRGNGIFKSTNGGATWPQLPSTTGPNFYFVNRLALSKDGKTLLAATRSGMYRSTNGGTSFTAVGSPVNVDLLYVGFDPTNVNRCVASGPAGRAFYSTNGGVNWTAAGGISAGSGRVELAYAANNPSTVYASVERNSGEVYRSTNNGQSYSLRNTGSNYLGSQGWYDNTIWAGDPTNANLVVVGGLDLYRSTDGGTTLSQISKWWLAPGSAHADHHAIVAHPKYNGTSNRTVFFGNDGGIYRASDVATVHDTSGWQELNNNYGVTQFYGAAGNVTSGRIVGGAQDNGTIRYTPPPGPNTGPQGWTTTFGGDGGSCASDPTNANFFYGEYVRLQVFRSVDAGTSASYIYTGITDAGSNANFIAPFILDPNNPNTMLAGGQSLWRSTNVTASTPAWARVKTAGASLISAIAVSQGSSKLAWVGYNNGDVFMSTDATAANPTWTQVDDGATPLPERYCTRITISPADSDRVYATFGGYNNGNIWKSPDAGKTWTDIALSAALPSVPVYDLKEHYANPNTLYAATEIGVYVSVDGGSTWYPTNLGPANVAVFELLWLNKYLVAVTHGRGIFWINP